MDISQIGPPLSIHFLAIVRKRWEPGIFLAKIRKVHAGRLGNLEVTTEEKEGLHLFLEVYLVD